MSVFEVFFIHNIIAFLGDYVFNLSCRSHNIMFLIQTKYGVETLCNSPFLLIWLKPRLAIARTESSHVFSISLLYFSHF